MENQTTNFDITQFEAADYAWYEVQNKKDDGPLLFNGAPVRVKVRSPGTREALNAQHKIDTANQNKTFAAIRGKQVKDTVDSRIEQRAEKLAAITIEFENFPASPMQVYSNPKMGFFTDQIEKFHGDWGNF